MFQTVGVRREGLRTAARTVAAGEQETAAALLDQSARHPTEHEELAGILVTQFRVAEERFAILHH